MELFLSFSILKVFEREFWINYSFEQKDLRITQDSPLTSRGLRSFIDVEF